MMGFSVAAWRAAERVRRASLVAACVACVMAGASRDARAIDKAEAAKGPPFNIDVLVSSRSDVCYDPGDVAAIKKLTSLEVARINKQGGVSGRPLQLTFRDDKREEGAAISNVRASIDGAQTLGIVGLSNATRAKAVFDTLGPDILKSGVPFLSDIALSSLFAAYPNVYTMRASQDADSVPVMTRFSRQLGLSKAGFVGMKDSVAAAGLADGLRAEFGDGNLVADIRLAPDKNDKTKLVEADIAAAVVELGNKRPELLFLNVSAANAGDVIKALMAAGNTPALFIGGRIENLPDTIRTAYPNAIYNLNWDRPPEVFSERMRNRVTHGVASDWVFEGAKIPSAPQWAKGECKPREEAETPDPFSQANQRAIGVGSQFADMIGLLAAAAENDQRSTDLAVLRKQILTSLQTRYASGNGTFKGSFDNWSFVPASRAAARDPFVVILPQGLGRTQLAPVQFVRTKDGGLRQIETLYADIDLIKAHRVDENGKSFFAEFYLSMRDHPGMSIEKIEFANAYLDAQTGGGRQITVETVHPGGKSNAYPDTMKIYKVSGRFLFEPELANYPFDTQRFAIDLQPKNGEAPFIVQPPPLTLRDRIVTSDGWTQKAQYVGYDEDFVPVVDAFTHAPSVVPFYKASFTWLMQREATDYFLRVVVPLGFILFVGYLSIFIPRTHFEAIVTIQVTALLSAVALYLSLPKLDSDAATLSDQAFVYAYLILSIMIGISIMRITGWVGARPAVERVLGALHLILVPLFIGFGVYYVYGLSTMAV